MSSDETAASQPAKADVSQTIPDEAIEAARTELWRFDDGQRNGAALKAVIARALPVLRRHIADEEILALVTTDEPDDLDIVRNNAYHRAARVVRDGDK